MKRVLIRVKDKSVLMNIRQYGDYETVSAAFNIYCMEVEPDVIFQLEKIPGVVSIKEDECFNTQKLCLT